MATGDSITAKLAAAKSALTHARTAFPSSMAPPAAPVATAKPAAPVAPASRPSVLRQMIPTGAEGREWKQGVEARKKALDTLIPKMHNGGPVTQDGPYQLKAGEHVLTEAEVAKAKKHALMAAGMKSLAKAGRVRAQATKEQKTTGGLTTTKKMNPCP